MLYLIYGKYQKKSCRKIKTDKLHILFWILHSIIISTLRYPWCNGYRRRKWTRRHEFISSHSTNILGKGMNPIILPPAMGK